MTRSTLAGGAVAAGFLLFLALAVGPRWFERAFEPAPATSAALPPSTEPAAPAHRGFLYGRVTTGGGAVYQGRLRFGGREEAFWDQYFNGFKAENSWAGHVPPERLTEHRPVRVFGLEIARRKRRVDLGRPFMARFGDVARIDARGRALRVTLKSGAVTSGSARSGTGRSATVVALDRFAGDDFADGVRVWDAAHGVVDLDEGRIRSIEFLPTGRLGAVADRLHGTVRTGRSEFTGFVRWDREGCVGSDVLAGGGAGGERRLRFDTLRSIARRGRDASLVTLLDGRELVLSGSRGAGRGHRGMFVHDPRYGRVLVSWDAFERVDFSAVGGDPGYSGPAYDDFPPGRPLTGSVTTRDGRRLAGRLVYDLDESETTATLDAPARGVSYSLPFGRVASVVPAGGGDARRARVTLHGGEELWLEPSGDLGLGHAGVLVFVDGRRHPEDLEHAGPVEPTGAVEHVRWADVERIDLDPPPAR